MVKCKKCDKEFATEAGLKDHLSDAQVHRENSLQQKAPYGKLVLAVIILVVICGAAILVYRPIQLSTAQTTSTVSVASISTSSTSLPDITLQQADFKMNFTSGCLFTDATKTHAFLFVFVMIQNRWNESVQYVNASFVIVSAHLFNGTSEESTWPNYTTKPVLIVGASNTKALTFTIPLPISSPKLGHYVLSSAVLSVLVWIKQNGKAQQFSLTPNIVLTPPVPVCPIPP